MKRAMIIVLVAILLFPTACRKKEGIDSKSAIPSSSNSGSSSIAPEESASNKLSFEIVDSSNIPKVLLEKVNKIKKQRGFTYYKDDSSGSIYLVVLMGEKPTGGYSISVVDVEDYDDKIKVQVQERVPDRNQMVTMALTQPYTVVKIKSTKTKIIVENQSGMKLEKIDNEQ